LQGNITIKIDKPQAAAAAAATEPFDGYSGDDQYRKIA
jgi:hypothetical protein